MIQLEQDLALVYDYADALYDATELALQQRVGVEWFSDNYVSYRIDGVRGTVPAVQRVHRVSTPNASGDGVSTDHNLVEFLDPESMACIDL